MPRVPGGQVERGLDRSPTHTDRLFNHRRKLTAKKTSKRGYRARPTRSGSISGLKSTAKPKTY